MLRLHWKVKVQTAVHAQLVLDDLEGEPSITGSTLSNSHQSYLIHVGQLPLERVDRQSQVVENCLIVERLHELSHEGRRTSCGRIQDSQLAPSTLPLSFHPSRVLLDDNVGCGFGVNGGLLEGGLCAILEPMITVL